VPFLERSFERVFKMIAYPHIDVRKVAIDALCQFCICFNDIKTPEGRVGKLLNSVILLTACPSLPVLVNLDFPFMAHVFFLECLSNHCQGFRHTFPEVAQNLLHTCCWINCKIASGQIHDSK
jgi:hypothetical protein